ncbi:MAG: hypothetical protein R2692_03570 [Microbacterium sp.]
MVSLKGTDIVRVPFADALGRLNTVPIYRCRKYAALFGGLTARAARRRRRPLGAKRCPTQGEVVRSGRAPR